jgi:ankyrin repeat protein
LGQTCLHAAVFSQNTRILKLILQCNPDVKIEDITGLTAYHYSLMDNNQEIISMFNEYLDEKSKSPHRS